MNFPMKVFTWLIKMNISLLFHVNLGLVAYLVVTDKIPLMSLYVFKFISVSLSFSSAVGVSF